MRTKNFTNLMAMIFERCGVAKGLLPVVGRDGVTYYVGPTSPGNNSAFPYTGTWALQTNANNAGFCVGSGTTAADEDDYDLESQITSGISASVVVNPGLDESDNPYVAYDLTITNTGSESITIGEIGFKQSLYTTTAADGTSFSNRTFLLDRTVLDTSVTIPAGSYAVIRYTLKTDMS